jgi:hypothetical protein
LEIQGHAGLVIKNSTVAIQYSRATVQMRQHVFGDRTAMGAVFLILQPIR